MGQASIAIEASPYARVKWVGMMLMISQVKDNMVVTNW